MKDKNHFKKIITLVFLILVLKSDIIFGQYQNIMISNLNSPAETSIAINPVNPNQMVVGTNSTYQGINRCSYFYTTNGGLNWSGGILYPAFGILYCDPGIASDKLGNFYFTGDFGNWINPPLLGYLYCMKSSNGGANWVTDTFANCSPKMDDMPTICVDNSNSIYQNNIYVVYTQADTIHTTNSRNDSSNAYFCRSTDHGQTFSIPKRISKKAGIGIGFKRDYLEGCVCCTGPEGQVYAAWVDSIGVVFDRSIDAGNSWLDENIRISSLNDGWNYYLSYGCAYDGTPWIDCDNSNSPNKGTVYLSWIDNTGSLYRTDVWLSKSTNMGINWSQPVRVNNDPINLQNKAHYFTHIAVDQANGNLYCSFYDNRSAPNIAYIDLYLARSTDGGSTFANVKVNSNQFSLCSVYYGDYIGLAAYNNKVRPVWAEGNGSAGSIWTAIIDTFTIGIKPISNYIPENFLLYQNYPNPFNPATNIKFDLPKSTLVKIKIYDILGKEIETLVNENLLPGSYKIDWNASQYPSGIYFYKMETANYVETKRMILMK
jgi:hypothetical protein